MGTWLSQQKSYKIVTCQPHAPRPKDTNLRDASLILLTCLTRPCRHQKQNEENDRLASTPSHNTDSMRPPRHDSHSFLGGSSRRHTNTHEKHMGSLMLTQAIPSPSHGRSPEVSAMAANCWLMLLCNFLPYLIPTHVPPFVLPCLTLLCPCPTSCIVSNLVQPKSNLVSYLVLPPMSSCLSYHARSYPCPTSCPTSSHPHPTPCPTMSDPVQPMVRTCPSSSCPCPTSGPTCVGPFSYNVRH